MFGKSTITNKLLNKEIAEIGDISKKNKKGKNTTTDITLHEIEENSYILDTPRISDDWYIWDRSKRLSKLFYRV